MKDKHKETLERAIRTYGIIHQLSKLQEESIELSLAIFRLKEKRLGSFENMKEEIADVEVVIEQIKMNYNLHEEVEKLKELKIERLEQRMNDRLNMTLT